MNAYITQQIAKQLARITESIATAVRGLGFPFPRGYDLGIAIREERDGIEIRARLNEVRCIDYLPFASLDQAYKPMLDRVALQLVKSYLRRFKDDSLDDAQRDAAQHAAKRALEMLRGDWRANVDEATRTAPSTSPTDGDAL